LLLLVPEASRRLILRLSRKAYPEQGYAPSSESPESEVGGNQAKERPNTALETCWIKMNTLE
jgi:hypothetical protein